MENTSIKHDYMKYVSLNVMGMIGLSCYILADTFFVARGLGSNGLTALNLAIPIYSFIHGSGLMIGMGGATRFTISKSKHVFTQALYYASIIAFVCLLIGISSSNALATFLGANEDTLFHTNMYLKVILCFSPMFLFNNIVLCFVRNDGNPKLAMIAMLVGSFSNVVLDYIFIFPLQMGMFGAAFATGLAPVISLCILSTHFMKKKHTFYILPQKPQIKYWLDISSLGVSALITEFSSGIVIIIFNFLILNLEGNIGVAAYGIIANIALVVIAIFTGIAQGMQPMISSYYRMKRHSDIKTILKYGILTSTFIAFFVYLVTFIFAQPIVFAFNKEADYILSEISVHGLRLYFTAFVFVGINILCSSYFSAIDKAKYAFIISLLRGFVVLIPVAFLFSFFFGMNGIWLTMTCSELFVFFISMKLLRVNKLTI